MIALRKLFCGALLLCVTGAARAIEVDPALPAYARATPLTGKLNVASGESMKGLLQAWVAMLQRAHPGVEVVLDIRDSSYAPKALIAGTAQVGFMGRLLWEDEKAKLVQTWGAPPQQIVVSGATYDDRKKTQALAVFVHRDNPIRGLTLAQLDAIFSATRRRGAAKPATTWGDLGLTGEWANRPVHPVVVKTTVGHALYFREFVLRGGTWQKGLPEYAEDKVVPEGVAPDRDAIGVSCVPFGGSGARMVALAADEGAEFFAPTLENVASRRYPLSRLLYFFVRPGKNGSDDPVVRELMRIALSRDGQSAALAAGFLPLSAEFIRAESG
jgi:phosphate transport system substrate-binding protein